MAKGSLDQQYYALLAKRIREGDEDAFVELYNSTYDVLARYVYYFLRDQNEVPDVLQEIYIAVYKNIGALKIDRLLIPWMRQIAYHVCCDWANDMKTARENASALEGMTVHPTEMSMSEAESYRRVFDQDTLRQIRQALDGRPVKERQAFMLRYQHGLKLEEIADFLGVSLASVKRYILSARETLQSQFSHLKR